MGKFNINEFRSRLTGDGSRPSQFRVLVIAPPAVGLDTEQFSFMAEAASLPNFSVGVVPVPYWGRRIFVAGDRNTGGSWQLQVINDESFDVRGAFERWSNNIASVTTRTNRVRGPIFTSNPNSYVGSAIVEQYGKEGGLIRSYKMTNVWPSDMSGIDLNWSASDQISRFSLGLTFDSFELVFGPPADLAAING